MDKGNTTLLCFLFCRKLEKTRFLLGKLRFIVAQPHTNQINCTMHINSTVLPLRVHTCNDNRDTIGHERQDDTGCPSTSGRQQDDESQKFDVFTTCGQISLLCHGARNLQPASRSEHRSTTSSPLPINAHTHRSLIQASVQAPSQTRKQN